MSTATITETKDRRDLREALQTHVDTMDRIMANGVKIDGANVEISDEAATEFKSAKDAADKIAEALRQLNSISEFKDLLTPGQAASIAAAVATDGGHFDYGVRDLGAQFIESDAWQEFKRATGPSISRATMDRAFEITVADLPGFNQRKDVFTASAPIQSTRGFGRTQFDPMVPRQTRTARVRDLFPVARTDANNIDFFRVIGFGGTRLDLSTSAAPVPERSGNAFALKPQSGIRFESANAVVRTIAHYEVAHRNVLGDEPQLQSTINNELLYGLRIEEDFQILSGDGTGENLLGILNTPGIQSYDQADTAGDTRVDALRRSQTFIELAYYEATGIVLHPRDWERVELTKDDQDRYVLTTNVAVGAQKQVWQTPVVATPAIVEGTYLTGAFGLGAQLYDREQANIRVAEQHADFFIRNAVAILAEERLALAVKRPEAFVSGELDTTP